MPWELMRFCMYTQIARYRLHMERIPKQLRLFCFGHTPFRQRARRNSRHDAALDEKGLMCPGSNGPWEPRLSRGPIPRPTISGAEVRHGHAIGACAARRNPHVCAPTEQRGPGSPCEKSNNRIQAHTTTEFRPGQESAPDKRMRARRNLGSTERLGAHTTRPCCAWISITLLQLKVSLFIKRD